MKVTKKQLRNILNELKLKSGPEGKLVAQFDRLTNDLAMVKNELEQVRLPPADVVVQIEELEATIEDLIAWRETLLDYLDSSAMEFNPSAPGMS